jgi:hypothetical protein
MIDEKKKQNGMKACFDRRIDDKVEREFMRDPLIAYTRAFEDAIDWFKKALWHTEDEIPEADRLILVKDWKLKDRYSIFDTTEELNLEDFDKEQQWDCFCKLADFDVAWCYIEDILPKGGEK